MLFRVFGCKIKTKRPFKKRRHIFGLQLYSVKYENLIIGVIKRSTSYLELPKKNTKVGKKEFRSFYLFEISKYELNSDLENLISFSVIYRFIGLRCETEMCSINLKNRLN